MHFLLVHPWITDVAAYNFWIRPLGLYSLSEWLWERRASFFLLDCLTSPAPGKFKRKRLPLPIHLRGLDRAFSRYGIPESEFDRKIEKAGDFDAVLMTSDMSYWYPGVQQAVQKIKGKRSDVPVILGGIYATLWPEHARKFSGADHFFEGPLEKNSHALSSLLNLPVQPIRKKRPWHKLSLHDGMSFSAISTSRGCPFRCTYCASLKISGSFAPRKPEEIIDELSSLSSLGVTDISFYDDALLMDFSSRLLPVLDELQRLGLSFRFHTPNGLHARMIDEEMAAWFKKANFATIRLSLETTNPLRQEETGAKVNNAQVESAVKLLIRAGIPAENIGVYLMIGLPGQDLKEVFEGMAFVRSLGVRPYLSEYSPIPGTPDWNRLLSMGIVSKDMDPILTNNTVFFRKFCGYEQNEIEKIIMEMRGKKGCLKSP